MVSENIFVLYDFINPLACKILKKTDDCFP